MCFNLLIFMNKKVSNTFVKSNKERKDEVTGRVWDELSDYKMKTLLLDKRQFPTVLGIENHCILWISFGKSHFPPLSSLFV